MEDKISIVKLLELPENFVVVPLILSLIFALVPYFPGKDFGFIKIPQFTPPTRKKLRLIGPFILIASGLLFVPIIPQRASMPVIKTKPGTVTILVAEFEGPSPQSYRVTEKIIQRLRTATSEYSDISIQALGQSITEQQGSEVAREAGMKRQASIVLWGYYGATSEIVDISVYFEVLQKPRGLSLRQNLETQTSPISELNGFKIQTRLSGEMTYLTLLTIGLARYESGDYDGAIKRFTKAIDQSDVPSQMIDRADIYFYRGTAYCFQADAEGINKAIADFDRVIEIKSDNADAYNNRGVTYDNKGEQDHAIADYDKAIKLRPDYAEAYNNRGNAYNAKGEYDRAIADYDKTIELKPDDPNAYYNRAIVYKNKGERDHAISDLKTLLQITNDPNLRQLAQQKLQELGVK